MASMKATCFKERFTARMKKRRPVRAGYSKRLQSSSKLYYWCYSVKLLCAENLYLPATMSSWRSERYATVTTSVNAWEPHSNHLHQRY